MQKWGNFREISLNFVSRKYENEHFRFTLCQSLVIVKKKKKYPCATHLFPHDQPLALVKNVMRIISTDLHRYKNKNNLFVSTQKIHIQYYDKTAHTVYFLSNVPSVSITAFPFNPLFSGSWRIGLQFFTSCPLQKGLI
jgi:hypothetical protein